MSSEFEQTIVAQTKSWLQEVVIGLNFCPFAKPVFEQDKIHYHVSTARAFEDCLEDLIAEAEYLEANTPIETSLLIFPDALEDFEEFLDALEVAEALMTAQGYEGIYQLASFHPQYCFEGSDETDAANYTNRSPFPMLHLIREASLEQALLHYKNDVNLIPETNMQLARKLGVEKMQSFLTKSLQEKA